MLCAGCCGAACEFRRDSAMMVLQTAIPARGSGHAGEKWSARYSRPHHPASLMTPAADHRRRAMSRTTNSIPRVDANAHFCKPEKCQVRKSGLTAPAVLLHRPAAQQRRIAGRQAVEQLPLVVEVSLL